MTTDKNPHESLHHSFFFPLTRVNTAALKEVTTTSRHLTITRLPACTHVHNQSIVSFCLNFSFQKAMHSRLTSFRTYSLQWFQFMESTVWIYSTTNYIPVLPTDSCLYFFTIRKKKGSNKYNYTSLFMHMWESFSREQLANLSYKGPDRNYFKLCKLYSLCWNY